MWARLHRLLEQLRVRLSPPMSGGERVQLRSATDAAVAGSVARRLASRAGASPRVAAEIATAAAELASNVIRHGGGGHLEVRVEGDLVSIAARNDGARDATTVRARLAAARQDPIQADRGVGTLVRFMDDVDVAEEGDRVVVSARRRLDARS